MGEVRCLQCDKRVERSIVRPSLFGGNDIVNWPCQCVNGGLLFDYHHDAFAGLPSERQGFAGDQTGGNA